MLDKKIREKAKSQGLSLNKTIKKLLKKSLGINQGKETDHRDDFMDIFGAWSEEDLKEFNRAAIDFGKIDPDEWK
jgi:hypothetical protein